jgi:ABC-type lipoprotein export system ATPase subunit
VTVTHDAAVVAAMDRTIHMRDGLVDSDGALALVA